MSINRYAQINIDNNKIVNVIIASSDDVFDPAFLWDDISGVVPKPQIDWTYVLPGIYTAPAAPVVSIPDAIQINLAKFQLAMQEFIESRYSTIVRMNFIGIYLNAVINNLSNRQAYIGPLFVWQNSIIEYASTYMATVRALTDSATIASTVWDFSALASSDPGLSPLTAIQIED